MDVDLLLVPYDSGVRGWRMGAGPEYLLNAGLDKHLGTLGHRVRTAQLVLDEKGSTGLTQVQTSFALLRLIATHVTASVAAGRFPLVVAGNCLSASGILAGLGPGERAVVWFDAHADLNTPDTTPSGFVDGMALATAIGWCWKSLCRTIPGFTPVSSDRCCLVGSRHLDPPEEEAIRTHDIAHVAPSALPQGLQSFLSRPAVAHGTAYVHCDLDVLDPSVARVNGFPAPGGLRTDAFVGSLGAIAKATAVRAAAITAYDPAVDPEKAVPPIAFAVAAALVGGGGGGERATRR